MDNPTCANGHTMLDGDAFCGECGAPPAPDDPTAPPPPPAEATPAVEQPPAPSCPSGHANPTGNKFCGTCGRPIEAPQEESLTRGSRPRRRIVAVGAVVAVLMLGLAAIAWQSNRPGESSAQKTADFYSYGVPHGEDAWRKIKEVCDIDSDAVMTDYEEVTRSDFDAYYVYEDALGMRSTTVLVSLNDYGAITWVDTCNYIEGLPVTFADRVDVDWGDP